jgi:GT2 family glycosyltransferase
MSERCSVIVLNYNGKQFLEECLTSLKSQSYGDYKVYVLDNASTDGSVGFIKSNFPAVEVIEAKENFGTAEGSNIGVRNTKGEYIVLMSNDVRVDRYCIENLVKTLDSDSSIGIYSSKLLKYDPDPRTGKYSIDNAGGIIDKFAFPMMLRSNEVNREDEGGVEEVFFSCGGCFITRRELFEKVGGFDRKYFTLSDDIDLSWRIRLAGYRIAVNHSAVIYHKVSATLGPLFARAQKRFWSERNSLRTILKNYQIFTLILILPQYFLLLFLEAGFYILVMRPDLSGAIVRAIFWNILNLADTLKERRKVKLFRVVNDAAILDKMCKGSIKIKVFLDSSSKLAIVKK